MALLLEPLPPKPCRHHDRLEVDGAKPQKLLDEVKPCSIIEW
jgi:hypothetical protein